MADRPIPPSMRYGRTIRIPDDARNLSRPETLEKGRPLPDFLETGSAGNSTILQPGGPSAAWRSFINLNTDDRKSIPLSITLNSYLSGNSNVAIGATRGSLDAKISWGAGGGSAEAIIDFMNGSVFTVVASSLAIDIRNTYPILGFNQNVFSMSAFVSKGPKGSGVSPQRTVQLVGTTTGDNSIPATDRSLPSDIPQFAKTVRLTSGWENTGGAGVVRTLAARAVELLDGNGNPVNNTIYGRNEQGKDIVIPNGVVSAVVYNLETTLAASLRTPQLVYQLAI